MAASPSSNPSTLLTQISYPGLTDLIESGRHDSPNTDALVKHFCDELLAADANIEEVLLAYTHYPIVYDLFRRHLPSNVDLITQGAIVADRLDDYLHRHPDIDARLDKAGTRTYHTTNGTDISTLASRFYGSVVQFEKTRFSHCPTIAQPKKP